MTYEIRTEEPVGYVKDPESGVLRTSEWFKRNFPDESMIDSQTGQELSETYVVVRTSDAKMIAETIDRDVASEIVTMLQNVSVDMADKIVEAIGQAYVKNQSVSTKNRVENLRAKNISRRRILLL